LLKNVVVLLSQTQNVAVALPVLDDEAVPNFCDNIVNREPSRKKYTNLKHCFVNDRSVN